MTLDNKLIDIVVRMFNSKAIKSHFPIEDGPLKGTKIHVEIEFPEHFIKGEKSE